jgi:ribosomal protein L29
MAEVKKPVVKKTTSKKAVEIKTVDQLKDDLVQALSDQMDSKRSHAQGELVNPHVLTVQRKAIARLHTAINAANGKENK